MIASGRCQRRMVKDADRIAGLLGEGKPAHVFGLWARWMDGSGFLRRVTGAGNRATARAALTILRITASSSSIPRILASVASQASTSAISAANSSRVPDRSAVANSPNSSVSQRKVTASPRAASSRRTFVRSSAVARKVSSRPELTSVRSWRHLTEWTTTPARAIVGAVRPITRSRQLLVAQTAGDYYDT